MPTQEDIATESGAAAPAYRIDRHRNPSRDEESSESGEAKDQAASEDPAPSNRGSVAGETRTLTEAKEGEQEEDEDEDRGRRRQRFSWG